MRNGFSENSLRLMWRFMFVVLIVSTAVTARGIELSDNAEISVITCSPGNEAYSVYGHSAIRVKDEVYNYDVVFNYGIFDFSSPNFVYRFAKGETDYMLGAYSFDSFVAGYKRNKRSVYEQVLQLSQAEKHKIFEFLVWNAKPENRVYRYNFLFDNCASRIRDVVENNIDGGIVYDESSRTHKTLRRLTKDYHGRLLWLDFGTDILVSVDADREATLREEMFLPDYVMSHLASAKRANGGDEIIKKSHFLYESKTPVYKSSVWTGPFVFFMLVVLILAWFSFKQYRKGKMNKTVDTIVYVLNGFMGVVLVWFVLYSEHPAMSPNYNLCWAVPLNLLFVFALMVKKWRPVVKYYHLLISAWLVLFVCFGSFLPQAFHPAFYLLALVVLCRSIPNSLLVVKAKS